MTGKIQNFCCVVVVVSHVTLQMSPCYETDHACFKYLFSYPISSFVVICIRVTVVGESYKITSEGSVKLPLLWQG